MSNVLIVDDEPEIREIVREILVQNGHRVTEATDGLDAVERLTHSHFDLIITDFTMPRMGGLGILKYLRKNGVRTPTVILSGSTISGLDDEAHLKELGAWSIVRKPIEIDELMESIKDALAHAPA
ncbi:MAG: response regulator [Planctomycetota bacterium]|nr:response regulator [Planctomycetota bacterium]